MAKKVSLRPWCIFSAKKGNFLLFFLILLSSYLTKPDLIDITIKLLSKVWNKAKGSAPKMPCW